MQPNQQPNQQPPTPTPAPSAGGAPAQPAAPAPQPAPTSPPQPTTPQPQAPPTIKVATQAAMPPPAAPVANPAVISQPQQRQINPNSTQNALQIAEIRDGIVIMSDGTFRSVVMAKSINFDLMSPEEREAVEFAYQGFLNSLYFKIQIFIRSNRVDIRPYLERLDKMRLEMDNMLLALLMEDYIDFINALSEETNIMDKQFYIVIPYAPPLTAEAALASGKKAFGGLFKAFKQNEAKPIITINETVMEQAKTELRNRVQAVVGGLQQMSVQSVVLDTRELSELYYNTYNPDTATRQKLINVDELSAPVITKGAGDAVNPNLNPEGQ